MNTTVELPMPKAVLPFRPVFRAVMAQAIPALLLGALAVTLLGAAMFGTMAWLDGMDQGPISWVRGFWDAAWIYAVFVLVGFVPTLLYGAPVYAVAAWRFGPRLTVALAISTGPAILGVLIALIDSAGFKAGLSEHPAMATGLFFSVPGASVAVCLHFLSRAQLRGRPAQRLPESYKHFLLFTTKCLLWAIPLGCLLAGLAMIAIGIWWPQQGADRDPFFDGLFLGVAGILPSALLACLWLAPLYAWLWQRAFANWGSALLIGVVPWLLLTLLGPSVQQALQPRSWQVPTLPWSFAVALYGALIAVSLHYVVRRRARQIAASSASFQVPVADLPPTQSEGPT